MKLLSGVGELPDGVTKTVATIGNFDGVHLGHQALIDSLLLQAQKLSLPSLVILFEPQPGEFFQGTDAPERLSSLREKLDILASYGVDYVYCLRFGTCISQMSAAEFATQYIFSRLRVGYLLIGDDFRFGYKRGGDTRLLQEISQDYKATVSIFSDFVIDRTRVSSTVIRKVLNAGDLEKAQQLLGRPYSMCGRVVRGDGRGRTIGAPTANLRLNRKSAAIEGVFCVKVKREKGSVLSGVANVGTRPTVDGKSKPIVEVHLFDFDASLYGEMLTVYFMDKLRDEKKFSSLDGLVEQINNDINAAKKYFQDVLKNITDKSNKSWLNTKTH